MKRITLVLVSAIVSLSLLGAAGPVAAEDGSLVPGAEVSFMGGIQALNENDTGVPDRFINIPAVVTATYHVTPIVAIEGELTWMIPLAQNIEAGPGVSRDRKSPDVLVYMANLRVDWPRTAVTPYLTAGAGAVTFLSNTDQDRLPQLDESQTAFAVNFGAGLLYGLTDRWALRADAREFVAFPADDAAGLSDAGGADEIWMERGTLGLVYRF